MAERTVLIIAVARILKATVLALRTRDGELLNEMERYARAFLRRTADLEVHHKGMARGGYAYSSGGDVEKTTQDVVNELRDILVGYLEFGRVGQKTRGAVMAPEEMARHFVGLVFFQHEGSPLALELVKSGLIIGHYHSLADSRRQRDEWAPRVGRVFRECLDRMDGKTPSLIASNETAEMLVCRGLAEMGYRNARNIFDSERKKVKR